MIRWRDKFDFVVVVCAPSRSVCVSLLEKELSRVGLAVDVWQYGIPNEFDSRLTKVLNMGYEVGDDNPKMRNSTIGHLLAVNTAYRLGVRRMLVIEDDIRFLKDLDKLELLVGSIPENADIVQMDVIGGGASALCWVETCRSADASADAPKWLFDASMKCASFACLSLNRNAMEWVIRTESESWGRGSRMSTIDRLMRPGCFCGAGLSKAIPVPLVARQVDVPGIVSNSTLRSRKNAPGCPFNGWYDTIGSYRNLYGD